MSELSLIEVNWQWKRHWRRFLSRGYDHDSGGFVVTKLAQSIAVLASEAPAIKYANTLETDYFFQKDVRREARKLERDLNG